MEYAYDSLGQRIKQITGASTTIYATAGYNVTASSTVKQIMANGILLATIDKNATSSAVTRYVLNDHLGGTNLVTDDADNIVQTADYYPYGSRRINVGTDVSQREYIGQEYDEGTSLSYLNARYYEGSRGQFLSQDPMFLGDPKGQNLSDPQSLNSYSYAGDNPIVKSDPTGKCFEPVSFAACAVTAAVWGYNIGQIVKDGYGAYVMSQHPDVFSAEQRSQAYWQTGFDGGLTLVGGVAAPLGARTAGEVLDALTISLDTADHFWGDKIYKNIKKSGPNDESKNKIQVNIGIPANNQNNYYQSGGGAFIQPNQGINVPGQRVSSGSSQQIGGLSGYQQLVGLYSQLVGLYQQLLNLTSDSNKSNNTTK